MLLRRPLRNAVSFTRVPRHFTQQLDTAVSADQAAQEALKKFQQTHGRSIEQKLAMAKNRLKTNPELSQAGSNDNASHAQASQTIASGRQTEATVKEQVAATAGSFNDASNLKSDFFRLWQRQPITASSSQEAATQGVLKQAVDIDKASLQELIVSPLERFRLQVFSAHRENGRVQEEAARGEQEAD